MKAATFFKTHATSLRVFRDGIRCRSCLREGLYRFCTRSWKVCDLRFFWATVSFSEALKHSKVGI